MSRILVYIGFTSREAYHVDCVRVGLQDNAATKEFGVLRARETFSSVTVHSKQMLLVWVFFFLGGG